MSKKKLSEVLRIYENRFQESGPEMCRLEDRRRYALRAALEAAGVELAPEPEPLPGWWGERLEHHTGGVIGRPGTGILDLTLDSNRAALALSHSLRVAAAELLRWATREDGSVLINCATFVHRLRKILIDNKPPEAGS